MRVRAVPWSRFDLLDLWVVKAQPAEVLSRHEFLSERLLTGFRLSVDSELDGKLSGLNG